jgi:hypothetical protein
VQGIAAGDPRLGGTVRLLGRPGISTLQLSLGLDLWLPLSHLTDPPAFAEQVGETTVRFAPKLLLTAHTRLLQAALTTGFYYRPEARLGFTSPLPGAEGADFGNGMGSQLQAGLSLLLSVRKLRLQVGPEATFATVLTGGRAFSRDYTGLTLLLGLHHRIKDTVLVSLGGGLGLLRQAGIPDGQALLRLAYAPRPRATDFGEPHALPQATPPVLPDQDGDGLPDEDDQCPQQPDGLSPDPQRPGCPLIDQDHDGVADRTDLCPQRPAGPTPDAQRPGCPAPPPVLPPQLLLPQPLPAERPEPPPEPLLFDEPPAAATDTAAATAPPPPAQKPRPRAKAHAPLKRSAKRSYLPILGGFRRFAAVLGEDAQIRPTGRYFLRRFFLLPAAASPSDSGSPLTARGSGAGGGGGTMTSDFLPNSTWPSLLSNWSKARSAITE